MVVFSPLQRSSTSPPPARSCAPLPAGRVHSSPLVIVSAGFLLDGTLYRSYCQELATWGYAALLYDCSELLDDRQAVVAIR